MCPALIYYSSYPSLVSSGSVSVNADSSVQLLAEEACAVEDIDLQVCVGWVDGCTH